MATIRLFGSRLSPFVEKAARALDWKRLDWSPVDLRSPGDFRRWNPVARKMPVLEVDGERVYDSTFILRRLDELAPEPPLFAADPAVAAAQRLLEDWSDEGLYFYLMALRWAAPNRAATLAEITSGAPAPLRPLLRPLLARRMGSVPIAQGLGRLPYEVLLREAGRVLDDLVLLLGRRPFFHADRPSAADLAVYGQLSAGRRDATPDFRALVDDRPPLGDHMKRVEEATRR
jgi:glutathione S-transferase